MTFDAVFPGDNDLPVSVGYFCRAVEDKTDQKLVLLGNGKMMTVMAVEILMLTGCPGIIGRLHEVAADAEFRIVLGKVIEFKGNDAASDNHGEKKDGYNNFPF